MAAAACAPSRPVMTTQPVVTAPTQPAAARRIGREGSSYVLPDGTRVAINDRGGFTLPNGQVVVRERSGALLLPNGSRCIPDASGYACP